jgi:hypothetical protein
MIEANEQGGYLTLLQWVKGGTVSYTVPTNQRAEVKWFAVSYTCSAVVASRVVTFSFTTVNGIAVPVLVQTLTASQSGIQSIGLGQPSAQSNYGLMTIPVTMYPGQMIGVTIAAADAGDTWKAEGLVFVMPWQMS